MKYFSNRKGFTIVELMVVIAIIGILTAIVTANFTQSRAKARDAKRVSDLAQIQLTLEMIFDRCNTYPTNIDSETTTITGCLDSTGTAYTIGYFISKLPKNYDGNGYTYSPLLNGNDYILSVQLETSNSSAIQDSAPGTVGTNTCGKANYYCVVPK